MKKSWSRKELEEEIAKLETDLAQAQNQARIWSETVMGMQGHLNGLRMMLERKPTEGGEDG